MLSHNVARATSIIAFVLVAAACSSSSSPQSTPRSTDAPTTSNGDTSSSVSTPNTSGGTKPDLANTHIAVRTVVRGLDNPVAFAIRKGDPALYIAEQYKARVLAVVDGKVRGTPLLDLHGAVSKGNEQGLLGIAFSPDGERLYVDYTDTGGDSHVDEYQVRSDGTADADTQRQVLVQKQPFPNHNGGEVAFGPDGMLYIGFGDGGAAGDPFKNGQNRNTLLGKILRIDPQQQGSKAYTVPSDNPFVGASDTRPEVWMWGLRNPWRFSFDRTTGDMWIGDVGQNEFEEIDMAPKGTKGQNFGWGQREGFAAYNGQSTPANAVDPVYAYSHGDSACSVTGGFVYRGSAIAALRGGYVFADFCQGDLVGLTPNGTREAESTPLGVHVDQPTSFGQDADGELYVLSRSGSLLKIVPA